MYFYMASHLLLRHYYGLIWKQHGDSVELEAPDMIRQQNVFLCVKPSFDQFCSVSSSSESVCLCREGDKVSRKAYGCIHTRVMICFISRRSERNRHSIVSSFSLSHICIHKTNRGILCLTFCYWPSLCLQCIAGILPLIRLCTRDPPPVSALQYWC